MAQYWTLHFIVLYLIASAFGLLAISASVLVLRKDNPNDVSVAWYFFSLAFVSSFMVIWWANRHAAFTAGGGFVGQLGDILSEILKHMMDFEEDMAIFGGLAALLVLPQFMAYVLCAPFRCSAKPWFVGTAADMINLTAAKFFIVNGGITASFLLAELVFWSGNRDRMGIYLFLTLTCVPIGFLIITVHREASNIARWLSRTWFGKLLRGIHIWASKYRQPTLLDKVVSIDQDSQSGNSVN